MGWYVRTIVLSSLRRNNIPVIYRIGGVMLVALVGIASAPEIYYRMRYAEEYVGVTGCHHFE